MSNNTGVLQPQPSAAPETPHVRWQRMTFAGLLPGEPPRVTLHAIGQTKSGLVRHFSQTLRVLDESVLLRLVRLSPGTEMCACIETDWKALSIGAALREFSVIEAAEKAC